MGFEYMGYFMIAIILLFLVVKILGKPLILLLKLILNGILGVILLVVVNLIGSYFAFHIGINAITAIIAGFFGIPGVIFLIIFKLFL